MRSVRHFFEGLVLGSANVIPGVSGGTMALIFGIYEALVAAISHSFSAVLSLARLDGKGAWVQLKTVDWGLLIPLGLGIVASILSGAKLLPYLLETYPQQSRGLFFGLIIASVAIPWLRMRTRGGQHLILALAAAALAFVLSGLSGGETDAPSLVFVFFAGALAITTMILPGVSGSHVLLVLGIYSTTLSAISAFDLVYIAAFGLGAGLGLGLFSKLLEWLLEHHHDLTMAALIGLMFGSLRALWPWLSPDNDLQLPGPGDALGSVIALIVLGLVAIAVLTWWGRQRGATE